MNHTRSSIKNGKEKTQDEKSEQKPSKKTEAKQEKSFVKTSSSKAQSLAKAVSAGKKTKALFKKSSKVSKEDKEAIISLLAEYEKPLDRPVFEILCEAREVEELLKQYGKSLYRGKTLLDKKSTDSIPARRRLLAAVETQWIVCQCKEFPKTLRKTYQKAARFKQNCLVALRYFLQTNEEVQQQLDTLQIGANLEALVKDLCVIGSLLARYELALKKAKLPKNAAEKAFSLSNTLEAITRDPIQRKESNEYRILRDCVFWWLREVLDDVYMASRYAFRNRPELLWKFRPYPSRDLSQMPQETSFSIEPIANSFQGEPLKNDFLIEMD